LFSLDGSYQDKKLYFRESGVSNILSPGGLNYINDEFQYVSIGQEQFTDINDGFLVRFDEEGDTLEHREFRSPYYEEFESEFMAPVAICNSTNEDNSIFISTSIFHPDSGTGGDFYIQRMAPDGEVLWEYIYATPAQPEYCNALLPTENGGVLGILREVGVSARLIHLSDSGALISIIGNELSGETNDLIWSDNSNEFIGVGGTQGEDTFLTGRVFKMDTTGELIWDTVLGNGYDAWWGNRFYKVVKSQDNSGYVAGGTKKEYLQEEEQTDSTGITISQGWLVKVDEDGDVLWDRTYHYINTPNEEHTLNDLKATSDGGYIFCGESRDLDSDQEFSEGPPQQGWLVKVDEYGCLVAGCQLSDNISEQQTVGMKYFRAGPIPSGDFLNIYQSHNAPVNSIYQLIDMNGKVVEEFQAHSKGSTMMLSVDQFSVGGYQLVLKTNQRILQLERILIE